MSHRRMTCIHCGAYDLVVLSANVDDGHVHGFLIECLVCRTSWVVEHL